MKQSKNKSTNSYPRIYLDNNASTPLAPEVLETVVAALSIFGNPSSVHSYGQEAKALITKVRETLASFLSVRSQEIIFTSCGTEALNLVLRGFFGTKPHGHIVTSSVEHAAVYNTVKALEEAGCTATYLSPGLVGAVTKEMVASSLQPDTRLITLTSVNSETGVKTDIKGIGKLAKERGIPFVVDGVGHLGKELFTIDDSISAMCFSGHKIHAPKGAGFAFIRKNLKLTPYLTGGHQEAERRAGTENVAAIAGLGKAIELVRDTAPHAQEKMAQLRDHFERELMSKLTDVVINGSGERVCNTSNLAFLGVAGEGEMLLRLLDLEGIAVSHGSACASGALEPSRILLNMGISRKHAASSLRFSLSRYTTEEEIERAIQTIIKCVRKIL